MWDTIQASLIAPMPLFFAMGLFAKLIHSDLKIPDQVYVGIVLYLLASIGLQGGEEIRVVGLMPIWKPLLAALFLAGGIPLLVYPVLRFGGRFSVHDAAAIAGHYGSVSAVTYATASQFLTVHHIEAEEFTSVLLAVMEPAGVASAILLAKCMLRTEGADNSGWLRPVFREVMTSTGTLLLIGSIVIGYLSPHQAIEATMPFFGAPFRGILCLFMVKMGQVTAERLSEVRSVGLFLVIFGIFIPIATGMTGVLVGGMAGLSLGGAVLLGVLAASASYIAAPAAMRLSLSLKPILP